jgi:hypothetical protein
MPRANVVSAGASGRGGNIIGHWAFLIGVILAIILGLAGPIDQTLTYLLVIMGLIIGLANIADREASPFLMAAAVLIIASSLGQNVIGRVPIFNSILQALLVVFVPATIIVAIKHVFSLAKD